MYEPFQSDYHRLGDLLEAVKKQSLQYLSALPDRPTRAGAPPPTEPAALPLDGLGGEAALQRFNARWESQMVASSGPRYWGFVTGGSTPAALAGDMLTSVYDQNTQSVNGHGDVSAALERETIDLLRDLWGLPAHFFGGFVTGATMSNFTSLAVARQWWGCQKGIDIAKDGMTDGIRIFSASAHSSVIKSLSMLGIGSRNLIKVATLPDNREAMDLHDLDIQLARLAPNEPFIIIASAGTVNSVDYDDFTGIAALRKRYPNGWLHIDAAFGAFAACSPAHRHYLAGWETADSITVDCHKWLNVPYDSAVFLIDDKHRMHQVETFQNSNAPYLGDPMETFNYLNFLPENSRRLRALPAWFSLQAYGKSGYEALVTRSIANAQQLAALVEQSPYFELLAPVWLNNLVFTLQPQNGWTADRFLHALTQTGRVFMTPTIWNGTKALRASFVNWMTRPEDVEEAFTLMERLAAHPMPEDV
ncbi:MULTISPECIES: pyridoxal-dependent decarboxylase [unclassified Flavobacterium]|uniref:pyridoxal phosphate-dependent decarboxylase family protein n=1 Tax=unclassified Flavobacterium TaxID=196869 RepID=UPI001F14077B|nr:MULTISPECIES: pyridoxal-dependent decarboxylase [unclassified Flavobacterium]UMY65417.1 pyridoxal-dependent decarboxylase [Flavobacterium sp. HJ-32-4]